ncbi:MAG: D-alanine--D-alanine ligase [Candidatus Campbellbacteria bacterium]|nr:D-alanine--D-alanine ligase [Candidatus Campbellbacteria bacterium]
MSHEKIRVGVLRGGPSNEYEVSLRTGQYVLDQLRKLSEVFEPVDILISRNGAWHLKGIEVDPKNVVLHIDVAFVALHGEYGEDGKVQALLERHGVPYTGSDSISSALGMNKHISKEMFEREGIRSPLHIVLDPQTDDVDGAVEKISKEFPLPMIVKPASGGSSVGVSLISSYDHLREAVTFALEHSRKVLIEEFISGREATVGVLEDFRNEELYSLLPVEIAPTKEVYDYEDKYTGESKGIYPGNFSEEEKRILQDLARNAHNALGLRHYSRSDFIVAPDDIYILEVNSLPGLTETSHFPKSLEVLGIDHHSFIEHLIYLALNK